MLEEIRCIWKGKPEIQKVVQQSEENTKKNLARKKRKWKLLVTHIRCFRRRIEKKLWGGSSPWPLSYTMGSMGALKEFQREGLAGQGANLNKNGLKHIFFGHACGASSALCIRYHHTYIQNTLYTVCAAAACTPPAPCPRARGHCVHAFIACFFFYIGFILSFLFPFSSLIVHV